MRLSADNTWRTLPRLRMAGRDHAAVGVAKGAAMRTAPTRAGKHTVDVWGKPYNIEIRQKSKTVWVAVGTFMGEPIEVKRSSARAAAKAWREAARFRGN